MLNLSGSKISCPSELRVMRTGSKQFPSGSVTMGIVSGTIPFAPLDFMTSGSWLWEKLYCILDACGASGEPASGPGLLSPHWHFSIKLAAS